MNDLERSAPSWTICSVSDPLKYSDALLGFNFDVFKSSDSMHWKQRILIKECHHQGKIWGTSFKECGDKLWRKRGGFFFFCMSLWISFYNSVEIKQYCKWCTRPHSTQILPRRSLLYKYHSVSRYIVNVISLLPIRRAWHFLHRCSRNSQVLNSTVCRSVTPIFTKIGK